MFIKLHENNHDSKLFCDNAIQCLDWTCEWFLIIEVYTRRNKANLELDKKKSM